MSQHHSGEARPGQTHPIDLLLAEIARRLPRPSGDTPESAEWLDFAAAVEAAGGPSVVNLAAAFASIIGDQGTILGAAPPERLEDVWTLQVCHRIAESYHHAFTSRDPSGEVWRRHVAAWERAHLEPRGYFRTHRRAAEPPAPPDHHASP
jgi:hypothetical protein